MRNLVIVLAAIFVGISAGGAASARLFPIGIWYEGGVGEFRRNLIPDDPAKAASLYKSNFADIAAHGLNAAVVPNTQPNHHKVLLDAANASGVKLIVELDREGGELGQMVRGSLQVTDQNIQTVLDAKLKPIMSHPGLWGVQLMDEPFPDSYERYAKVQQAIREYAPKLLPFCCLVGLGNVEPFLQTVKPEAVAVDNYPIGLGTPVGDRGVMLDFDGWAKRLCSVAEKYKTPTWAVLQTHAIDGYNRFPTPAEARCMTYLSLANGCKGIWWFLYQTEYSDKEHTQGMYGVVDKNYKGSDRWREVGLLAREIRKLAPTLLDLTPADDSVKLASNQIAHTLKDGKGRLYLFVVNVDTGESEKVSVSLDVAAAKGRKPRVFRLPSNRPVPCELRGGGMTWEETLAPGRGALYRIAPTPYKWR